MDENPICARCECEYNCRTNCEPTPYCDQCAHAALAEIARIIEAVDNRYVVKFDGQLVKWADEIKNEINPEEISRIYQLAKGE